MRVFLGLGSNLGNKLGFLKQAISQIADYATVKQTSSIYETEPWGFKDQDSFLNLCLEIDTALSAEEILKKNTLIEDKLERARDIKWGPRTIDIDLLFYDNEIIKEENIIVPHPELHKRNFVLVPLNEIAAHFIHPVLKKSIKDLNSAVEQTGVNFYGEL